MKKSLSRRYFSIVSKNLSDISKDEAHNIAITFIAETDAEWTSLITLLSFFDDKEDVEYALKNNKLQNVGNLKPLIRDILREYRKTLSYPTNTLCALIEHHHEAYQHIIDIMEEIHERHFYDYMFENNLLNNSLSTCIDKLTELANDARFPLQSLSIKDAKNVFFKEDKEINLLLNIGGKKKEDITDVKTIELLIYLKIKQREGLTFEDILEMEDEFFIPLIEFFYSLLFVYEKTPYDLMEAKSEWLRETAINVASQ